MADLFYSDEALNVKSAFYRANSMVFVEGDDDVLFWHEVFSKIPEASVEVESAGGSDQIDQYITKILSGELQAIAARDSDFLPHMADIENDQEFSIRSATPLKILFTQLSQLQP